MSNCVEEEAGALPAERRRRNPEGRNKWDG